MMNIVYATLLAVIIAVNAYAQTAADYLITENIGRFVKLSKNAKGSATNHVLAGIHFGLDHREPSYGFIYINDEYKMWVDVRVTHNVDSDSDRWLEHELDSAYRGNYGIPDPSYNIRKIDGNTILAFGAGGWDYRWLSGTNIIQIEYNDEQMTKPEPVEIIKAYLDKYPSSLPNITHKSIRSEESKSKWIKEEMERRLWLCDKWFQHEKKRAVIEEVVKNMVVFLRYREKYFRNLAVFKIKADDEIRLLENLQYQKNDIEIKKRLEDLKTWWQNNKSKSIVF
jgi:hypothetical protein